MQEFNYTIKDEIGIHARPAGVLSKLAKSFESKITVSKDGRSVDVAKLIALMGMGIKCGDTVTVSAEGADEIEAIERLKKFMSENL
ncbi:MAG: HPr family phosphocarrier protein [Clostridia bacterium]|nr:HPr family phosphocarrier protein [Clostridia bacterium]